MLFQDLAACSPVARKDIGMSARHPPRKKAIVGTALQDLPLVSAARPRGQSSACVFDFFRQDADPPRSCQQKVCNASLSAAFACRRRSVWDPAGSREFFARGTYRPVMMYIRHVPLQAPATSGTRLQGARFRKEIANGRSVMMRSSACSCVQVPVGFWDPALGGQRVSQGRSRTAAWS
jgi:hypothetical protein